MGNEKITSPTNKEIEPVNKTIRLREWADMSVIAGVLTGLISLFASILEVLSLARDIPPVLVNVLTIILSIIIVMYAIWFLYKRQLRRKTIIEDALKSREREFLSQVNKGFSMLLKEEVG